MIGSRAAPVDEVVGLEEVDPHALARVGGKGAGLGALVRLGDVPVPPGFCVTTDAFARALAAAAVDAQLDGVARLGPTDHEAIAALAGQIRRAIEAVAIPDDLAAAITRALERLGPGGAFAVRSSATAEDSEAASFAGQHDTYLDVVGAASVLAHVRRCWASLFSDRAVAYRLRQGIDVRRVHMAVVVQRLVAARVSGVLFTADPETGHRRVSVVEATVGLGEALVSGRARADRFEVRGDAVSVRARVHPEGATLVEAEVLALARLGRRIEAAFGAPQDIEWCLADDGLHVVQSRPITTLFPVPVVHDRDPHVYLSVGHQQMMTDAMRPLGISVWQLSAGRPMHEAGGRLFVDVARALASPAGRAGLLDVAGRADPLIRDALEALSARGDVVPGEPDGGPLPVPTQTPPLLDADPALVAELIARADASVATLEQALAGLTGAALVERILKDLEDLRSLLFDPRSAQAIMTAVQATWWLDDHLARWLGEDGAADVFALASPNNATTEMGLALLEVADVIRPFPEVVACLEAAVDDGFMRALPGLTGGREAVHALRSYLDRYGMRCAAEIDLTTPRWAERPSTLLPILLAHVRTFAPGEAARRVARGRERAADAEARVLERLRAGPDGEARAAEAKRMIDRVRAFIGYREHPKYTMVRRYFRYKRALLGEAERLVAAGVLGAADDVFYLTLPELHDVVRTRVVDAGLVRRRRDAYRSYRALRPPRVMTSDGEIITGVYRRADLPPGALPGLAVSGGVVEGRARVVSELGQAALGPDDVLVTTFTDPSWTPLFVGIKGLVTEVGGLMSHGSVIAREYGLPAVVGVERATRLIHDGQRIRVNGTAGWVELLPSGAGDVIGPAGRPRGA